MELGPDGIRVNVVARGVVDKPTLLDSESGDLRRDSR